MPMVSVVVPVYNVENVLRLCIDSILNQTFTDFELILVDDGSADKSGEICDEYAEKDKRVSVIHNKNMGVSFTRNTGIEIASGDYICFVDSDDYINQDYLKMLVEAKINNEHSNNIWCGLNIVSDYNNTIIKKHYYAENQDLSSSSVKDIMTLTEKMLVASPCNKLYNTNILKKNNIRMRKGLSLGEDVIFNLEYLDCTDGKILIINQCLYNYAYALRESLDNKYYSNLLDIHTTVHSTFDFYIKKWNCDELQKQKNINAMFYKYEVVLSNTFSKKNKDSFIKKMKYNKSILSSAHFKEAFDNCNCTINRFYRIAYKNKSAFLIYVLNKVVKLKKKLKIW